MADPQPLPGGNFAGRGPDVSPAFDLRGGSDHQDRTESEERSSDQRLRAQRSARREFLGNADQVTSKSGTRAPGGPEFGPATQSDFLRQSGTGWNLYRATKNDSRREETTSCFSGRCSR